MKLGSAMERIRSLVRVVGAAGNRGSSLCSSSRTLPVTTPHLLFPRRMPAERFAVRSDRKAGLSAWSGLTRLRSAGDCSTWGLSLGELPAEQYELCRAVPRRWVLKDVLFTLVTLSVEPVVIYSRAEPQCPLQPEPSQRVLPAAP